MSEGNVPFFKAEPCAAVSDARMLDGVSRTDDLQGVVLERFKGSWPSLPQTWRRSHPPLPPRPYKAAAILPKLFNDSAPIILLDIKTEVFTFSPSRRIRRAFLYLV